HSLSFHHHDRDSPVAVAAHSHRRNLLRALLHRYGVFRPHLRPFTSFRSPRDHTHGPACDGHLHTRGLRCARSILERVPRPQRSLCRRGQWQSRIQAPSSSIEGQRTRVASREAGNPHIARAYSRAWPFSFHRSLLTPDPTAIPLFGFFRFVRTIVLPANCALKHTDRSHHSHSLYRHASSYFGFFFASSWVSGQQPSLYIIARSCRR
ncbi:hypothetical protein C8R45DRAFT_641227, partial [Mycena sanguinolenta]